MEHNNTKEILYNYNFFLSPAYFLNKNIPPATYINISYKWNLETERPEIEKIKFPSFLKDFTKEEIDKITFLIIEASVAHYLDEGIELENGLQDSEDFESWTNNQSEMDLLDHQ